MQEHVGIIVLNWNGLEDTRACLQSLFHLDGAACRIYVVDNGSTDGSVEALGKEFLSQVLSLFGSTSPPTDAGFDVAEDRTAVACQ